MRIRIVTIAKTFYDIDVEENDFDEIVNKILGQKYLRLNHKVALLTSAIVEIQRL